MQTDLCKFLQALAPELEPLIQLVKRLGISSATPTQSGWGLSPRPAIAPEAFALLLYKPLPTQALDKLTSIHALNLPDSYRRVLEQINGVMAFELSLYGVPPGSTEESPFVDRSEPQPHDITLANKAWRFAYQAPVDWQMIGGGQHNDDEIVGYFAHHTGRFRAILKGGQCVGEWPGFSEFLACELLRAELAYPAYESAMAELRARRQSSFRGPL